MKQTLFIFGFLIVFISCKRSQPYFEGVVESTIEYETSEPKYIRSILSLYGQRVVAYVSRTGNVCRQFMDTANTLVRTEIIRLDSVKLYSFTNTSDTLQVVDLNEKGVNRLLSCKVTGSKNILGKKSMAIEALYKVPVKGSKDSILNRITYYNCPAYKIHPNSYKLLKANNYNRVGARVPFMSIGYDMNFDGILTIHATATNIRAQPVADSVFNIPQKKIRIATQL